MISLPPLQAAVRSTDLIFPDVVVKHQASWMAGYFLTGSAVTQKL